MNRRHEKVIPGKTAHGKRIGRDDKKKTNFKNTRLLSVVLFHKDIAHGEYIKLASGSMKRTWKMRLF